MAFNILEVFRGVRKQPIIALYFEFENELKFYNLEAILTGVYLLDFFCSGIQFYLLSSPYLCFIILLYLDLYVLGDDALVS